MGAAAAVLVVALGGVWLVRDGAGGSRPDGRWQVLPHAFEAEDDWMSGPQVLVADPAGCFAGFGRDGLSTAYWVGAGDCTRATVVTPPKRTGGDSLPSEDRNGIMAAVPAHGGGYLGIARHTYHGDAFAYETAILRGDGTPDGWHAVAQFDADEGEDPRASHVGPIALATTETGYVAVGQHNERSMAWLSADGATWQPVELPRTAPDQSTGVSTVAAAPDGRLVAIGTGAVPGQTYRIATWLSSDGGRSWQQGTIPDLGGHPLVATLLHDGRQFVALGGVDGDTRQPALVLTSADGQSWQVDTRATETDARMITAGAVLPNGGLLAVSSSGKTRKTDDMGGTRECATAWHHAPGGEWTREDLGCDGVPTSLVPLRDGRVAAVYWTTLFIRAAD